MMIRNVCLEDLQDIIDIKHKNFSAGEAASPDDMKERILTIPGTFLIAGIDGRICGCAEGPAICQRYLTDGLFRQVVSSPANDGFIAVTSLSTALDSRGQGIGMALLATMKDLAIAQRRIGITLTCHENLIFYHERNGFSDKGKSKPIHGNSSQYSMIWESPTIGR